MKSFSKNLFLLSEAAGILASSIYSLLISFIFQRYVGSQFINSLVGNIGVTVSLTVAYFAGSIVDKKLPWKVILLSDVLLIPLFILLGFVFNFPLLYQLGVIVVIDIISVIVSEFDSVSRPAYLKMVADDRTITKVIQATNMIQTAFAILGYLLVFVTIQFWDFQNYFIMISLLYIISAMCIYFLPKGKKLPSDKVSNETVLDGLLSVVQYILRKKNNLFLYSALVIFMVKNQIVMSLLIYKIGRFDPGFQNIHLTGAGILTSVAIGAILNRYFYGLDLLKKRLFSGLSLIISGLLCIYVGHIESVESFYVFGLSIGGIFGAGLPIFNMLSSERIIMTPQNFQGRSLSFIRTFSVIGTLLLLSFLGIVENVFSIKTIYFDFSGILSFVVVLFFMKVIFREKE